MKNCDHPNWLNLCTQGNDTCFLVTDRLQKIANHISNPDTVSPSLFVLIGGTAKSVALRQLFGIKRSRRFTTKRSTGEVHLHIDPLSLSNGRPALIAEGALLMKTPKGRIPSEKCHEITRRTIRGAGESVDPNRIATAIYSKLLFPFADIFCFFSDDLGGFKQVARHLAAWLDQGNASTLPRSTHPRVVVVTEKVPPGAESEKEARKALLWLLREETTKDLSEQISAIDVIALFPNGTISVDARHRLLKERLMSGSDQVRKNRENERLLFSTTHFVAFHLFNFIKHAKSPDELTEFVAPTIASGLLLDSYPPNAHLFETLYKTSLCKVSKDRVIAFDASSDVMLRSGFISLIKKHLQQYFEELSQDSKPALEIHRGNLRQFDACWRDIKSSSTCLCCLRRRPQYGLQCGHTICENCVLVFGECCIVDPWMFKMRNCLLCGTSMPEELTVKVHPPTAGVGVLCIDGGGSRGVVPLELMKRIQDRIGLSIPFQKFFKHLLTISCGLIVLAMFINGWSIDDCTDIFEKLAKLAFQRRKVLNLPFLPRVLELLISYFADGLYPPENIEAALKQVFGANRSILDASHATATGTRVGLPVATVDKKPSCRIFTNYNGVGERVKERDHVIKPKDGHGDVPLWEIARSASAAPGFFPPKSISNIGTFQDAGPLENDPLISALSEVAAMFPYVEEPDFVVSLGTGEPASSNELPTDVPQGIWKNGAFPRLCRLFWEKMRDKKVKQAFIAHPRYHRLNIEFDGEEPKLDDTMSIPELKSKVKGDHSLSDAIDNIARCVVASLFYFELDSIPRRNDGKHVGSGRILCSLRRHDPAFQELFDQLSNISAQFYLDKCLIAAVNDSSCFDEDGNFRLQVELSTVERFAISLQQRKSQPYNISGSPFSAEKLIQAQGLHASFGRPDHRKRKAGDDLENPYKRRKGI
ncbi:patatin-like phospholipase-like protein [Byssothecium circinans]|uniref:Patatin-like phospholipase-like protein n=1 Tax=Byssothecium circinans TaxID=147558 RepID=A0A6A5T7D0_9PLEO|nr:patatin-like phospholipase-like protein [Byssothecium circinans]